MSAILVLRLCQSAIFCVVHECTYSLTGLLDECGIFLIVTYSTRSFSVLDPKQSKLLWF